MRSQDMGSRILRSAWGLDPPTTRGPKARSSVDDIVAAAMSLADADGLTVVSLAAVAAELGLTTTALYRYIDSKDTLVEIMVDAAVGPAPQLGEGDWRARALAWAQQLWNRYRTHPWLADVRAAGMPRYPQRLAWIDLLLRELDRGSVPDPMHTALLLDGLAHTFALLTGPANRPAAPPTWLLEAAASRYPRLAQELDRDWTDIEEEFIKAVTTVLRGAEPMSDGGCPGDAKGA